MPIEISLYVCLGFTKKYSVELEKWSIKIKKTEITFMKLNWLNFHSSLFCGTVNRFLKFPWSVEATGRVEDTAVKMNWLNGWGCCTSLLNVKSNHILLLDQTLVLYDSPSPTPLVALIILDPLKFVYTSVDVQFCKCRLTQSNQ